MDMDMVMQGKGRDEQGGVPVLVPGPGPQNGVLSCFFVSFALSVTSLTISWDSDSSMRLPRVCWGSQSMELS